MAKSVVLGLGGTGSRVIAKVALRLRANHRSYNDGNVSLAVLDTDRNDMEKLQDLGINDLPIFATSREGKVQNRIYDYLSESEQMEWFPSSPRVNQTSMTDGAGQMRVKSRLAFMDYLETGAIRELESHLANLFIDQANGQSDGKYRIMIVSSLAGGTGSGIFIQTALWIRNFFESRGASVVIRGIFLLPEIFMNSEEGRENQRSLKANAYAAVRELNALTKIRLGDKRSDMSTNAEIREGKLFDQRRDFGTGSPIYDFAFLMDAETTSGIRLKSLSQYESEAADLVYMQIFAPLQKDMSSKEDNLFKVFAQSDDPVFGACGAAKAVYRKENVEEYVALRMAQEALSDGWTDLDDQVKRMQDEARNRRRFDPSTVIPTEKEGFMSLFESKANARMGNFRQIACDIENEHTKMEGGMRIALPATKKVDDYMKRFEKVIAEYITETSPAGLDKIKIVNPDAIDKGNYGKVKPIVEGIEKSEADFLINFEARKSIFINELSERFLSIDWSNLKDYHQKDSMISLFLRPRDAENTRAPFVFVHPLAMRFMLYRLYDEFKKVVENYNTERAYAEKEIVENRYSGMNDAIDMDFRQAGNKSLEFVKPIELVQDANTKESVKLKKIRASFKKYVDLQAESCTTYATTVLINAVAKNMLERIQGLKEKLEDFFKQALPDVKVILQGRLNDNLKYEESIAEQVICSSEKEKMYFLEKIQEKLLDSAESEESESKKAELHQIVAEAIMKAYCKNYGLGSAKYFQPNLTADVFVDEMINHYTDIVRATQVADLNIIQAIYTIAEMEVDAEIEARKVEAEKYGRRMDMVNEDQIFRDKQARKAKKLSGIVSALERNASEYLEHDVQRLDATTDDILKKTSDGRLTYRQMDFWGISKNAYEDNKNDVIQIDQLKNIENSVNDAYSDYEISCYHAVYGILAEYIPKFYEMSNNGRGGAYYEAYSDTIESIIRDEREGRKDAFANTPHIDKNWYKMLPYISREKRDSDKFVRYFLLALAYRMVYVDHNKYMCKKEERLGGVTPVMFRGRQINLAEMKDLLFVLSTNPSFAAQVAEEYETKFRDEVLNVPLAVENSELVNGLMNNPETNIVNVIGRCIESGRDDMRESIKTTLEQMLVEMIERRQPTISETDALLQAQAICGMMRSKAMPSYKDADNSRNWYGKWPLSAE